MYKKIQKLKRKGFNKSKIAEKLKLDPHTVAKYFDMSQEEYKDYINSISNRKKAFDPYKEEILDVYIKNDMKKIPISSIYDYLEEKHSELPGNDKTLRNYISYLIKSSQLCLSTKTRCYTKVEELPYGKQMQLDFGEYTTKSGLKIYIFAAVLSASRYKYIAFSDRPFTALIVIKYLLDCFDYFGGIPEELVIDQDRTMVVSENHGNIIYTKDFSFFIKEMNLKMYVCRKADPETKGKVENLVKFVKINFFPSRDFDNIDDARESVSEWLNRRANGKISQATCKIPGNEIEKERGHLRTIRKSIYRCHALIDREDRIVDKDSYISVDGSFYSVPIEYKGLKVEIYQTQEQLFVFNKSNGNEIACYSLSLMPGEKIRNTDHFRSKAKNIKEMKEEVINRFDLLEWQCFIELTFKTYSRYVRDQCKEVDKYFNSNVDLVILKEALDFCLAHKTYGLSSLYDTYCYYQSLKEAPQTDVLKSLSPGLKKVSTYKSDIEVEKRGIGFYKNLINIIMGVI